MGRSDHLTRRRIATLLATGSVSIIAGCTGTGDDNGTDDTASSDAADDSEDVASDLREQEPDLVVHLENADDEAVSSENATIEMRDHETDIEYTIAQEIEDGVAEPDFTEATTYTVRVISEEYEDAESELTLEAGDDEELSFELEAAS